MPSRKNKSSAKRPPKVSGILTTAAEAIGATLGNIVVKTGMVKPAPVKKSSMRAAAKVKPAASKKTTAKRAVSKKAASRPVSS